MADQKRVTIVHADGREYSIEPKDFTTTKVSADKQSYADQGFHIVGHVDGTPYDGPKTKHELERAAEERAAAREVKAADKPAEKAEAKGKD